MTTTGHLKIEHETPPKTAIQDTGPIDNNSPHRRHTLPTGGDDYEVRGGTHIEITADDFEVTPTPDDEALPPPHPNDPKQGAGEKKIPFHTLPFSVLAEDAVAHGEGALKYGRHNWREGDVLASTYYAAALRHLMAYIEGEDIDPDSGLSHLTKARASLGVLRDAEIHGTAIDDRPRPSPDGFMANLNETAADMARRVQAAKGAN